MTILLIIGGILLELIILAGAIYFIINRLTKEKPQVKVHITDKNTPISSAVIRDGVKSALREIQYEDERKLMEKQSHRRPENIILTSNTEEVVNSHGELIPFGLSDEEKKLLNMFYND